MENTVSVSPAASVAAKPMMNIPTRSVDAIIVVDAAVVVGAAVLAVVVAAEVVAVDDAAVAATVVSTDSATVVVTDVSGTGDAASSLDPERIAAAMRITTPRPARAIPIIF
jgi:hypothetical protein